MMINERNRTLCGGNWAIEADLRDVRLAQNRQPVIAEIELLNMLFQIRNRSFHQQNNNKNNYKTTYYCSALAGTVIWSTEAPSRSLEHSTITLSSIRTCRKCVLSATDFRLARTLSSFLDGTVTVSLVWNVRITCQFIRSYYLKLYFFHLISLRIWLKYVSPTSR